MSNKLFRLQKTGHLSCVWAPTGETKTPLACLWIEVDPAPTASSATSSPDNKEGGMRLCA